MKWPGRKLLVLMLSALTALPWAVGSQEEIPPPDIEPVPPPPPPAQVCWCTTGH